MVSAAKAAALAAGLATEAPKAGAGGRIAPPRGVAAAAAKAAGEPPPKFNSAPPPTLQYTADVALALAANAVDDGSGKVRRGEGADDGS